MNSMYNSFDSEQNLVLWGLHTFQYIDTVLNKILKVPYVVSLAHM